MFAKRPFFKLLISVILTVSINTLCWPVPSLQTSYLQVPDVFNNIINPASFSSRQLCKESVKNDIYSFLRSKDFDSKKYLGKYPPSFQTQLRNEIILILSLTIKGNDPSTLYINAALDQMYASGNSTRMLDVISVKYPDKEPAADRAVIDIKLTGDYSDEGEIIRIFSRCDSFDDLSDLHKNINIDILTAEKAAAIPDDIDLERSIVKVPDVPPGQKLPKKKITVPREELIPVERTVKSFDGARISYLEMGTGDIPLVLLHFWSGRKEELLKLVQTLDDDPFCYGRFRYYLIDLRGFGTSELKGREWKDHESSIFILTGSGHFLWKNYFKYCAIDVKEVLLDSGRRNDKIYGGVNLFGHSLGGMVAMLFAMRYPEMTNSITLAHTTADPVRTFGPFNFIPFGNRIFKYTLQIMGWAAENATNIAGYVIPDVILTTAEDIFWKKSNSLKNGSFGLMENRIFFRRLLNRTLMAGTNEKRTKKILRSFKKTDFQTMLYTLLAMVALSFKKSSLMEKIKCHVLIVGGEIDFLVGNKISWAKYLKKRDKICKGAPKCCDIEIIKGKHMSPQENPEELSIALIRFFSKIMNELSHSCGPPASISASAAKSVLKSPRRPAASVSDKKDRELALERVSALKNGIYSAREIYTHNAHLKNGLSMLLTEVDNRIFLSSGKHPHTEKPKTFDRFHMGTPDTRINIAVINGAIVGFIKCTYKDKHGTIALPEVEGRMGILPGKRGQLLGYKLTDSIFEDIFRNRPDFRTFRLLLPVRKGTYLGYPYFKTRYFPAREKEHENKDIKWWVTASKPAMINEGAIFTVTLHGHDIVERKLKTSENIAAISRSKSTFTANESMKVLSNAGIAGMTPVEIIVDTSLLSNEFIDEEVQCWSDLILSCRNMHNVSFVFRDYAADYNTAGLLPKKIEKIIHNAPDAENFVKLLREAIREKWPVENSVSVRNDLLKSRVRTSEERAPEYAAGTEPVILPITSKRFLEWIRMHAVLLDDHFPVAMDDYTNEIGHNIPLWNYQAALFVALAKAALVLIDRSDKKYAADEKTRILNALEKLYSTLRKDCAKLDPKILEYSVSGSWKHRLNRSIDLALPPITFIGCNNMRKFYEMRNRYVDNQV